MKKVTFIIGPTATGKTDLGIQIAKQLNGSIISADSRQMYIDMTIGTAKPLTRASFSQISAARQATKDLWQTPIQLEGVDHYLFDIAYPDERYTMFDFKEQASRLIEKLDHPIVVGGTGLYVDSLINNYTLKTQKNTFEQNPEKAQELNEIRSEIEEEYRQHVQNSCESRARQIMWDKLNEIDPKTAKETHPNNWRYVSRALELFRLTGESKKTVAQKTPPPFEVELIGIEYPREKLYERIELRIDMQMEQGLLEETKKLFEKYPADTRSLSSLGYLELKKHLDGELSLEEAVYLFKKNTRHFAKRQISWFRRYKNLKWIPYTEL